ncbi:MAG: 16S rRNA (guanine(527)-N(7))-methyltransferase RsmG [Planctomycetota bacterium]
MGKTWKREIEFVTDAAPIDPPPAFFELCERFGLALDDAELTQLARYVALLLANTERVNLTGVKDPAELWARHIFDALTLLAVLAELPDGSTVADVGTGGGLPGIPIAVSVPSVDVIMVEATGKKAAFLEMVIAQLGLPNAGVVCERAEDAGRDPALRERFDAVTARAVGPVRVITELCAPLCRVGGVLALVKGERASEELAEARAALHALHVTHETTMPTPTGRLIVLSKPRPTPRAYPRRPGEPKRSPL